MSLLLVDLNIEFYQMIFNFLFAKLSENKQRGVVLQFFRLFLLMKLLCDSFFQISLSSSLVDSKFISLSSSSVDSKLPLTACQKS